MGVINVSKRRFRQFIGRELWSTAELNCRTLRIDDWTICPVGIDKSSVVLSLGVADEIGFDTGIIEQFSCSVHAFDPTPRWVEWIKTQHLPEQFTFHPYAAGGKNGLLHLYPRMQNGKSSSIMMTLVDEGAGEGQAVEVPVKRIPTIMSELGIKAIDILKMDIEAAEYDVLDDVLDSKVPVYQLLVEFHHRFKTVPAEKTKNALHKLHQAGYRIFHISEKFREYSFIHEETYNRYQALTV